MSHHVSFSPQTPTGQEDGRSKKGATSATTGLLSHHPAASSPGMFNTSRAGSGSGGPLSSKDLDTHTGASGRSTAFSDFQPRSSHVYNFTETERYISSPDSSKRAAAVSHIASGNKSKSADESSNAIFGSASSQMSIMSAFRQLQVCTYIKCSFC